MLLKLQYGIQANNNIYTQLEKYHIKKITHYWNKTYPLLSQVGNQADFWGWS